MAAAKFDAHTVVVSRHPATIAFLARWLEGTVEGDSIITPFARLRVLGQATAEDVTGKEVYGNLPLRLAALAARVYAVEFSGPPPRGTEYDLAAMQAAGAYIEEYHVIRGAPPVPVAPSPPERKFDGSNPLGTDGMRPVGAARDEHTVRRDIADLDRRTRK